MQTLDLLAPCCSYYNAYVLLLHVPLRTSAVCQETAQRCCVNAAFASITRAQAGDPGPSECSPSYNFFQHKVKRDVLQSACRPWALLVCKECLWTAQLLRQAHVLFCSLHSNRALIVSAIGNACWLCCRVHACRESWQANSVAGLVALQQSCCSCMLAACHGCICSQVLSTTDECQLRLHLAKILTFSTDSIDLITLQYAGLPRRSVCLFLLHLCAVRHGCGQKVSHIPI